MNESSRKNERPQPLQGEAALPLVPVVEDDTGRTKMSFKLFTNPANVDSPKMVCTMFVLTGTESLRDHLIWHENITKVFTGLNLDTPEKKNSSILQLLDNSALTSYYKGIKDSTDMLWEMERATAAQAVRGAIAGRAARMEAAQAAVPKPDLREQDITAGLQKVIKDRSPYKVLEMQKRFMRRNMRKPTTMTTCTYVNHLTRINDRELPLLPPFAMNQSLSEEELKDIIHEGLPAAWKYDMTHQGFDCLVSPLEQMIHFCERMEATPNFLMLAISTGNNYVKPINHNGKQKSGKWCEHHENTTHNTKDCTTI